MHFSLSGRTAIVPDSKKIQFQFLDDLSQILNLKYDLYRRKLYECHETGLHIPIFLQLCNGCFQIWSKELEWPCRREHKNT